MSLIDKFGNWADGLPFVRPVVCWAIILFEFIEEASQLTGGALAMVIGLAAMFCIGVIVLAFILVAAAIAFLLKHLRVMAAAALIFAASYGAFLLLI